MAEKKREHRGKGKQHTGTKRNRTGAERQSAGPAKRRTKAGKRPAGTRRKAEQKRMARRQQIMCQRAILAGLILLIAGIGFIWLIIGAGEKKDIQPAMAEIASPEESVPPADNEPDTESAADAGAGAEDIAIAAEIGSMDDAEDQQAVEEQEKDKEDIGVETDDLLKNNDFAESGISLGIDVAKWQGTIDWQQVKAAGVDFAIVRVGYRTMKTGVIYEDPCARYNLQQAQAAGLKLGAYFFSTAVNEQEAKEEAAWVSSFVAQYPMTYPIAYNCEGFQSPESRQYELSQSERTHLASVFMDYISAQGYTPMFYAARNEMENNALWDMDSLQKDYMVWVSQYPDKPYPQTEKSSYSGKHQMWQYTSQGMVPGVPKGADMNVAYFGYSQTAAPKDSTPPEAVEANPEALIHFTEVDETVTAKIETNLRSVPATGDDATIVAKLKNGDTAQRTGVGHNGWSRVIYNGQKLYAVSSYLTTDLSDAEAVDESETKDAAEQPEAEQKDNAQAENTEQPADDPVYRAVNEPVTAKNNTNLRSAADAADAGNIVGTLQYGEVAVRTGIGSNGWSRLEYNGQTVYAISSYLTTDGNYKENNTPSLANPEAGVTFTEVNEQVTAKIETNLRNLPTTLEPSGIVAVLKNGETAVRTGVGSNGWSRLSYNGQTVYAVSSYLTVVQ